MMNTKNGKQDNDAAAPLSTVIDNLKRSEIGTAITAVYAVVDPDLAEFAAVAGDFVEVTPLATGVNYLVVAIGAVEAEAGIYFPEKDGQKVKGKG